MRLTLTTGVTGTDPRPPEDQTTVSGNDLSIWITVRTAWGRVARGFVRCLEGTRPTVNYLTFSERGYKDEVDVRASSV